MANLITPLPTPYEIKRKNRFIFRFPTDLGINEWYVITSSRPTYRANPVEIPFLNTSTYVAGRFIWEPIDITFKDPIGPSASQAIMEWVRLCSESITGRQGYAASYKKNVELEMLDPTGIVIEKWILQGAWPSNANFGSLSYSDDEIADITVTMQVDRCLLVY